MWTEFYGIGVDLCAIVAVEKGKLDHQKRDFKAILVHRDGTRIPVEALFLEVVTELNAKFPSSSHKCPMWGNA